MSPTPVAALALLPGSSTAACLPRAGRDASCSAAVLGPRAPNCCCVAAGTSGGGGGGSGGGVAACAGDGSLAVPPDVPDVLVLPLRCRSRRPSPSRCCCCCCCCSCCSCPPSLRGDEARSCCASCPLLGVRDGVALWLGLAGAGVAPGAVTGAAKTPRYGASNLHSSLPGAWPVAAHELGAGSTGAAVLAFAAAGSCTSVPWTEDAGDGGLPPLLLPLLVLFVVPAGLALAPFAFPPPGPRPVHPGALPPAGGRGQEGANASPENGTNK